MKSVFGEEGQLESHRKLGRKEMASSPGVDGVYFSVLEGVVNMREAGVNAYFYGPPTLETALNFLRGLDPYLSPNARPEFDGVLHGISAAISREGVVSGDSFDPHVVVIPGTGASDWQEGGTGDKDVEVWGQGGKSDPGAHTDAHQTFEQSSDLQSWVSFPAGGVGDASIWDRDMFDGMALSLGGNLSGEWGAPIHGLALFQPGNGTTVSAPHVHVHAGAAGVDGRETTDFTYLARSAPPCVRTRTREDVEPGGGCVGKPASDLLECMWRVPCTVTQNRTEQARALESMTSMTARERYTGYFVRNVLGAVQLCSRHEEVAAAPLGWGACVPWVTPDNGVGNLGLPVDDLSPFADPRGLIGDLPFFDKSKACTRVNRWRDTGMDVLGVPQDMLWGYFFMASAALGIYRVSVVEDLTPATPPEGSQPTQISNDYITYSVIDAAPTSGREVLDPVFDAKPEKLAAGGLPGLGALKGAIGAAKKAAAATTVTVLLKPATGSVRGVQPKSGLYELGSCSVPGFFSVGSGRPKNGQGPLKSKKRGTGHSVPIVHVSRASVYPDDPKQIKERQDTVKVTAPPNRTSFTVGLQRGGSWSGTCTMFPGQRPEMVYKVGDPEAAPHKKRKGTSKDAEEPAQPEHELKYRSPHRYYHLASLIPMVRKLVQRPLHGPTPMHVDLLKVCDLRPVYAVVATSGKQDAPGRYGVAVVQDHAVFNSNVGHGVASSHVMLALAAHDTNTWDTVRTAFRARFGPDLTYLSIEAEVDSGDSGSGLAPGPASASAPPAAGVRFHAPMDVNASPEVLRSRLFKAKLGSTTRAPSARKTRDGCKRSVNEVFSGAHGPSMDRDTAIALFDDLHHLLGAQKAAEEDDDDYSDQTVSEQEVKNLILKLALGLSGRAAEVNGVQTASVPLRCTLSGASLLSPPATDLDPREFMVIPVTAAHSIHVDLEEANATASRLNKAEVQYASVFVPAELSTLCSPHEVDFVDPHAAMQHACGMHFALAAKAVFPDEPLAGGGSMTTQARNEYGALRHVRAAGLSVERMKLYARKSIQPATVLLPVFGIERVLGGVREPRFMDTGMRDQYLVHAVLEERHTPLDWPAARVLVDAAQAKSVSLLARGACAGATGVFIRPNAGHAGHAGPYTGNCVITADGCTYLDRTDRSADEIEGVGGSGGGGGAGAGAGGASAHAVYFCSTAFGAPHDEVTVDKYPGTPFASWTHSIMEVCTCPSCAASCYRVPDVPV